MRMISLSDGAVKNLIFNEDLKQQLRYTNLIMVSHIYMKSMFTHDRSAVSTHSLRNCQGKIAVPLPGPHQISQLWWWGAVEQLIYHSTQAPTLASFKSACGGIQINHTAFMESRYFVIVFIFVAIRFS